MRRPTWVTLSNCADLFRPPWPRTPAAASEAHQVRRPGCSPARYRVLRPSAAQRINACTVIIESDSVSLPDKAKAFGNRGVAYANHNNTDDAVRDYEESLRLDGTSASSHRFRGNKYLIEENIEAAFSEYNEAIRLHPTDALALTNRGAMYVAMSLRTPPMTGPVRDCCVERRRRVIYCTSAACGYSPCAFR